MNDIRTPFGPIGYDMNTYLRVYQPGLVKRDALQQFSYFISTAARNAKPHCSPTGTRKAVLPSRDPPAHLQVDAAPACVHNLPQSGD
jgi:hypothetical protein